jgi:hypothetical protein
MASLFSHIFLLDKMSTDVCTSLCHLIPFLESQPTLPVEVKNLIPWLKEVRDATDAVDSSNNHHEDSDAPGLIPPLRLAVNWLKDLAKLPVKMS